MLRDNYTRYPRTILWLIREGRITIGGDAVDARPAFDAAIESFYIGKTPVTNLQYEAFDPGHARSPAAPGDDDPAVGVSFDGANGYCEWYAKVSRKPMRLPTEVEWEYACRGGTTDACFWGDDPAVAEAFVWDAGNSGGRARRAADKRPNPFGLLGMLGGIWEWTASLYRPYPARAGDGRDDPRTPGARVLRGGSFRVLREDLGSGVRRAAARGLVADDVGFRIARSLRV